MAFRSTGRKIAVLLLILGMVFSLTIGFDVAKAAEWSLFNDSEQKIQFLSIGAPEKIQSQNDETETVTWQFGYLENGTNGYIDATRLKQGSFAGFDVVKESAELRGGLEAGGRSKVVFQRVASVSGVSAIEFTTQTSAASGNVWYGVVRMLVLDDTLYTMGISAPSLPLLQTEDALAFLNSLQRSE